MTAPVVNKLPAGGLFPEMPACRTAPYPWIHQIAVGSLLLFAAGALSMDRDLVRAFELLPVLALLVSIPWVVRVELNVRLLALLLALVGWMLWVDHAHSVAPEDINVARFERVYARQFLFLVAGWWVCASLANARVLLVAAIVGCLVGLAAASNEMDWTRALNGTREDFGFHNAQHTALYFGSVLLALPALTRSAWTCRHPLMRQAAVGAMIGVAALCILVLGATHTRQTWVALILVAITVLVTLRLGYGMRIRLPCRTVAAAIVMVFVILAWVAPWQGAWERTIGELDEIASLVDPNSPAERSSATIRLAQWQFALETIAERPWTGHGGGATGYLLQQSGIPEFAQDGFGHVHNAYLEMAVQYGFVGLALWLAAIAILFYQVIAAIRAGRLDAGFAVFAIAWPVYFLILNLFESFTRYDSSAYVMFVFAGAIYGATLPVERWKNRSQVSWSWRSRRSTNH